MDVAALFIPTSWQAVRGANMLPLPPAGVHEIRMRKLEASLQARRHPLRCCWLCALLADDRECTNSQEKIDRADNIIALTEYLGDEKVRPIKPWSPCFTPTVPSFSLQPSLTSLPPFLPPPVQELMQQIAEIELEPQTPQHEALKAKTGKSCEQGLDSLCFDD